MKSIFLHKALLYSSIACLALTPFSQPSKKVVKQVQEVFNQESILFNSIHIDANSTTHISLEADTYYRLMVNDSLIGYAVIDKAPSKTALFDYLIITDQNLTVLRSRVITYREEYGGAIGSYRWLKQFIGKKYDSDFNDIAAISGATISVRSMKNAVQESLEKLHQLKSNHLIP